MAFRIIDDELFDRLHDDDAISLCCLGILQLVLLGVEGKRRIPDWMLRLSNDRVVWDNYPWGSYEWPTLYSQLKNANVRRAAIILKNVSVFTPKPSEHYLNITMRNVVEVFCKDSVLGSGIG
uniref:Phospholipase-like protein n=1 Tax=Tanacetum cinerariifolium TaxID=118510 RepID=A0A6L2P1U8_TANCI|nr:phospholipase-like protein [Tanacetum cinerariifolium]